MATNGAAIAPYSVTGKSAIITGAGSGINLEFAALLLSKGCNVLVADLLLSPAAEQTYASFAAGSPRALFLKTDVTNWGDLARAFDVAYAEFGDVDIIVPGAGVFEPDWSSFWHPPGVEGSASRDPVDGLGHYAIFDINVTHPVRMTQLALSHFLNPPSGAPRATRASPAAPKRILHVASIASEIGVLTVPMYCASKWAVSGFVRSLDTLEPALGIRVNAVAPGIVKTQLWTEDKLVLVGADDEWVTKTEVAGAMLKLVEDPEMVGGTVLEIGHDHTRQIPMLGNTGPQGPGHAVSNAAVSYGQVFQKLGTAGWGVTPKK